MNDASRNPADASRVGCSDMVRLRKCETCKHWRRWNRLTDFGRCGLMAEAPFIGPESSHASMHENGVCLQWGEKLLPNVFETSRIAHTKEIVEYILRGPGRRIVPKRIYSAAWEVQYALNREPNAGTQPRDGGHSNG